MSRRDQIRLSDEEVRRFLESSKTIIITTNGPGGFPHAMPMWYRLEEDGTICITTYKASQKVKNLRRDPRVSLLVESGEEYADLKGALIYGHAEIVEDIETVIATLLLAGGQEDTEEVREALRRTAAKRVVLRVKPERIVSWDHGKLGGVY